MNQLNKTEFTLPILTPWKKNQYLKHAQQVLQAQQKMQKGDGKTIIHHTLKDKDIHERLSHYPKGDRIDHNTGAQYFYHCHREDYETEEHGHFHCFLRYKHIPKHIKPTKLTDWDKYIENPMTHLVTIGMNCLGQPIRLFSVNRWVTSEICYDAKHTPNFLRRFKMTKQDDPYWVVLDQWVEGMLHLFAPQIAWLNIERDRIYHQHRINKPDINTYENEGLELISEIDININQQIEWIIN